MPLLIPKSKKRTALLRKLKEVFRNSRSQPVEGLIEVVRLTVPVNPFWPVTTTVNVPVELGPRGRAAKLYVKGGEEPLT